MSEGDSLQLRSVIWSTIGMNNVILIPLFSIVSLIASRKSGVHVLYLIFPPLFVCLAFLIACFIGVILGTAVWFLYSSFSMFPALDTTQIAIWSMVVNFIPFILGFLPSF
eukprot:gnl/Dysnectes_brevis/3624_a4616_1331.p1 GENE.gnl/Dysnectes_brevis/3624_a4616_1331~~gnl/Dysnectes_brevis/3624_a4616_1331.p1  ORF type:complete len:110 (+),score=5.36 gnl/Dysnectes_brevis/3624_a4616_1331:45-374(+)